MAEGHDDNDSVRRPVKAVGPRAPTRIPWGSDRRTGQGATSKGASPAPAPAANDEAANLRRVRAEESSPEPVAHELGFRDTTVMGPEVPPSERPKSHKRKVVSQEEPKAPVAPVFNPDLASLLLGLAEGMFTAAWGDEARFTPSERRMIGEPLDRIMKRMDPGDAARFAAFSDPVFLGAGLLIWGMRIWTMQQRADRQNPGSTQTRHTGPVVQGMPADQIVTNHEPTGESGTNGSANVAPHIAAEWGSI